MWFKLMTTERDRLCLDFDAGQWYNRADLESPSVSNMEFTCFGFVSVSCVITR